MHINRDIEYDVIQISKTSKPKALDEATCYKNDFHSSKLLMKRDWDKIKITDETPLLYLVMHFGYFFHVIFGSDGES